MTRDELDDQICKLRGVEDPCPECHGLGVLHYNSSATWRGGVGASCLSTDVCDRCWGSGDVWRPGVDLRKLRDEEDQRIAAAAVGLLAQKAGAGLRADWECMAIVDVLRAAADAFEKQRRGSSIRVEIRGGLDKPRYFGAFARLLADAIELGRKRAVSADVMALAVALDEGDRP